MKTVTLKLPDEQATLLEIRARELGRSKSALIREAVMDVLNPKTKKNCHEVMQAHCGAWKDVPADLSTNKKYLKGFGE